MRRKVSEKEKVAGDSTTIDQEVEPNRLVIELKKPPDKSIETRLKSPIIQLDGSETNEVSDNEASTIFFSFKSKHSENTILDSLSELWPEDGATSTTLVLRERLRSGTSDHLCTLRVDTRSKDLSWPKQRTGPEDVFREFRRI